MSDLLTGIIGVALLFALWGVFGLARPRRSCASGCGSCASAASCQLPEHDQAERRRGD
jgi:hypothetical protein